MLKKISNTNPFSADGIAHYLFPYCNIVSPLSSICVEPMMFSAKIIKLPLSWIKELIQLGIMSIASSIKNQEPLPEHLSKETLQLPPVTQNLWRWNLHETENQVENIGHIWLLNHSHKTNFYNHKYDVRINWKITKMECKRFFNQYQKLTR